MQEDTRQRILDCGRAEFLAQGYSGASLRVIAKAAGVTTGAIYGYFPDKGALFNALVEEAANGLLDRFLSIQQKFALLPPQEQSEKMGFTNETGMRWMVDYVYTHFDAFKLIICCSEGTAYADYIDRIVKIEMDYTYLFIETLLQSGKTLLPLDDDLMHILANALFSGMFEIVVHDMPKEKATGYIEQLRDFHTAGWMKILGME